MYKTKWLFMILLSGGLSTQVLSQEEIPKDYEEAKDLVSQEEWHQAARKFGELMRKYPDSAFTDKVYFWRAYSLQRMEGRKEEAFKVYQDLTARFPSSKWADDAKSQMTVLARALYQEGKGAYKVYLNTRSEDTDEAIKLEAISALSQMGNGEAFSMLERIAREHPSAKFRERALFSLAQADGKRAIPVLTEIAKTDTNRHIQERAVFWIGQTGGEAAIDLLLDIFQTVADMHLKERVVFTISQVRGEKKIPALTQIAKSDGPFKIREKAIFWLGQISHEASADALSEIFDSTEDGKLKNKVVFSLSQLSTGGTEKALSLLIHIAKDPDEDLSVRKKAIFWLGQTKHPEAMKVLMDVISE